MVELKRIYWTRLALRLITLPAVIWLFASAIVPLLPNRANLAIGQGATSVTDVLQQMFESVLRAIAAPSVLVIALIIIAVVMRGRDLQRRDPLRRFTGPAKENGKTSSRLRRPRRCARG